MPYAISDKIVHILGSRGVPAEYGGFEVIAHHLAPYLVEDGWKVIVYCQVDVESKEAEQEHGIIHDQWQGVDLVKIPVADYGNLTTFVFDWRAAKIAAKEKGIAAIYGYNTVLFNLWNRFIGRQPLMVYMDGLEWKRSKWPLHGKIWFYINELVAGLFGQTLVTDHPEIAKHTQSKTFNNNKITMVPNGGIEVTEADAELLKPYNLEPNKFALMIGRSVPENHILEQVQAWSKHPRGMPLVVLGRYNNEHDSYQQAVRHAASDEVIFPGAIYDSKVVAALRYYCHIYLHGHSVGGTNPSLAEAMGAGAPVIAHDNRFNRWVGDNEQLYYKDVTHLDQLLKQTLGNSDRLQKMSEQGRKRFDQEFRWEPILKQHKEILERHIKARQ